MSNPMLLIDGYKLDHRRQYPANTQKVLGNWTPRESRISDQDKVIAIGLQAFITKYLMEDMEQYFFFRPRNEVIEEYKKFVDSYLGPNDIGTDHIAALWDLRYVPLEFRSVYEGMAVPLRVPMLTVENTHNEFFWLTNYFETLMSSSLWLPSTSATTAWRLRKLLEKYAAETGSAPEFVDFQGHDFSMRGMGGPEAAELSGLGHLMFFKGTDSIPAINFVNKYYPSSDSELIGASVAATEHSVMCAGGHESELETFSRILDLYPSGIVSIVSDTWDLWKVCTELLPALRERILSRDGKIVIRPDSGDPADILCGDKTAEVGSPAWWGVIRLLDHVFGGTPNAQGYVELDSHIGAIYGDSITWDRAQNILERLQALGYASSNVVFGVGSYSYQYVTRDTFGFAMKATWAQIDGVGVDMFKQPITGNGMKNSAKGRLAVLRDVKNELYLVSQATPEQEQASLLQPVWRDSKWIRQQTFEGIRAIAQEQ